MDDSNRTWKAPIGEGGGNLRDAMADWAQQYGREPQKAPVREAASLFNRWARETPEQEVNDLTTEALQHMSSDQQGQIAAALLNLFQENGVDPRRAGVQTTDPQYMGVADVARMVGYVQREEPNLLQKLLSNRLVRMIILAILAYQANKLMRGFAFGGGEEREAPAPPPTLPIPEDREMGIGERVRKFIDDIDFPWEDDDAEAERRPAAPPAPTLPPGTSTGREERLRATDVARASDDPPAKPRRRSSRRRLGDTDRST
jgi:hypothetical protein